MIFLTDENIVICKLQALYFYAPWIPYHKKMLIMIDKVEQKYKNIEFLAINTDDFKGLCSRFSVSSIPSVIILNDGAELKRIKGLVMTSAFKSAFADIFNVGDNHGKEK